MSTKHFCLKWTRFQTNILSAFESLQTTEDLADVTLTCEGINIKAHKFILSACSPYFRTIFKENPCPHPIVILKDVCHSDLMAIINFMYHGEVTVSEEQLSSFLHTAMVLQVSGLMNTHDPPPKKQIALPIKPKIKINESLEIPTKKIKLNSKPKKNTFSCGTNEDAPNESKNISQPSFDILEMEKMKTDDEVDMGNNNDIDVNEKVEVIVAEKESQESILEAALAVKDKPSSILERSLTSQAGKSPIPQAFQEGKICGLSDISKAVFIPRKPPEETEKFQIKSCSESSSSPCAFEYPVEFLQQRIKTEDNVDNIEVMSPEELNLHIRNVELQPHHSSQCGNCPHCGKVYSNQSALKYHVRLVHSDLTNMYCCHLCPESFDYREGYKKHMAEVHLIRN